jgi:hypothetical protein
VVVSPSVIAKLRDGSAPALIAASTSAAHAWPRLPRF